MPDIHRPHRLSRSRGMFLRAAAASLALIGLTACSHSSPGAPSGRDAEADRSGKQTACIASDAVIFACRLEGSGDRIALCSNRSTPNTSYYVRENSSGARRIIREDIDSGRRFMSTRVFSSGATGIRTYSFESPQQREVLYAISGTGIDEQGTFVYPTGSSAAARERCHTETFLDPDWQMAESWEQDPVILANGLPQP